MRVRAITPIVVDDEEIARRQERYARLAPRGWEILVESLPSSEGAPRELSSPEQIIASEHVGVASAIETRSSDFDAVLPDCVLDPGLAAIEESNSITALGITRLSAHFIAGCGRRFGVVARNAAIGDEYRATIERYGLGEYFDGVFILGLDLEDLADAQKWNRAIEEVAEVATSRGVSILINGCSAVDVTFSELNLTVLDPTALALRVAALGVDLDLLGGTA